MKKIVMLCSALVLGVWPEAQASLWEIEAYTNEKEIGVTSKTSLVAITERMNKLNSVSTVDAKRVYRWLYDYWLSDPKRWSNDGKKSTFGNIQGYVNQDFLVANEDETYVEDKEGNRTYLYDWTNNFNMMLKKIENLLPTAAANNGVEIEDEKTQEQKDQDAAAEAAQEIHAGNLKTDYGNKVIWDYTFKTDTFEPNGHDGYIETDKNGNPILTYEAQKRIESELLAQKHESEVASKTEVQTQELAIDATDRLRESQKIQRNKLEEAVKQMESKVYDGSSINDVNTEFDLIDLAKVMGKVGVDVDEDFMVGVKRVWELKAVDDSNLQKNDRSGDSDDKKKVDPNAITNANIATFLLDHFTDTDTGSEKKTKWNLTRLSTDHENKDTDNPDDLTWAQGEIKRLLTSGRGIKLTGEDNVSKEIRDSLIYTMGLKIAENADDEAKYKALEDVGIEKNGEEFKKFKQMKFHLNLVARTLQEIESGKMNSNDGSVPVKDIWFHSFRQYMLQAFREAIFLIKKSEDPAIAAAIKSVPDPSDP